MKRNYLTPTCSLVGTVLKRSLLLAISGKVENPGVSDVKLRDIYHEGVQDNNPEWGQLW